MKQKSINFKYISEWLSIRGLKLEKNFAENLYLLACEYKKKSYEFKRSL